MTPNPENSDDQPQPHRQLTIQVSHGNLSDDVFDDYPTQYNKFTCDDSCTSPPSHCLLSHHHDHADTEEANADYDSSDSDYDDEGYLTPIVDLFAAR